MAYLLRALIVLMLVLISITSFSALGWIDTSLNHIKLAIPSFIYVIFAQAFVMFYFIGVSRLVDNIYNVIFSNSDMSELFDEIPKDLKPYQDKVKRYQYQSTVCKRQTIPWTMLMLVLGMIAFLLGGAHDTGMVDKIVHAGVVYGFIAAMLIGFYKQWQYLGRSHKLLREIKTLFSMSDDAM